MAYSARDRIMKILCMLWVVACSFVCAEDEKKADIAILQNNMKHDWAAILTQKKADATEEKGKLYWNAKLKRILIEMSDGTLYLYTHNGVHVKDAKGEWSFIQIPNDWARMLLEPEVVIREKKASAHKVSDTTCGLHLEEGGQFIYVFWTKDQLKGWIIGHLEQGLPYNDLSVDLEKAALPKLQADAWEPKSSFLDIK